MDAVPRLAARAARRIAAGALNGHTVAELAAEFQVSERHLRRAFERELGVSPVQLALTHRLLLAKRLLADTDLPVTRIAYASGFQSLRRFNAVFLEQYRMAPSALRRSRRGRMAGSGTELRTGLLRLTLGYRAPLAWSSLVDHLGAESIGGVDVVERERYARTVQLDGRRGAIFVEDSVAGTRNGPGTGSQERTPGGAHLNVEMSLSLAPVLMSLLARLRHLFDLDAEPAVIDAHLAGEGLRDHVTRTPGMRIPGVFDGFEVALRALLLGDCAEARTGAEVARRIVALLGEPADTGFPGLERLLPTSERVADAGAPRLHSLGLPHRRAETLVAIARAVTDGRIRLDAGQEPNAVRQGLLAIDGVSVELATTITMRALSWPDAYPAPDLRLSAHGHAPVATALPDAERWRPWRAYALLHLRSHRSGCPPGELLRTRPRALSEICAPSHQTDA